MKKLLGIVVLGLLLNVNSYAKDFTGKKLRCTYKTSAKENNKYSAIEFLDEKKLIIYSIKTGDYSQWRIVNVTRVYEVTPNRINLIASTSYINRENLLFRRSGTKYRCDIAPDEWDIQDYLETKLKELIADQESKNIF